MADHDKEEGEPRTKLEKDDEKEHFTVANCRMYEGKYPEVDDLVVVEVKSIEEMGAYVALKEYNEIEGMILLSELSRYSVFSSSYCYQFYKWLEGCLNTPVIDILFFSELFLQRKFSHIYLGEEFVQLTKLFELEDSKFVQS